MKIEKICPHCHKLQTLEVDDSQYYDWMAGKNIQRAFPNLSADQREILMSGICPECWEDIFGEDDEEDIHEESEYNEFGIDTRTGDDFPTPDYN